MAVHIRYPLGLLLAAGLLLGSLGLAGAAPPLPAQKKVLSNGLTLLVLQDSSVPSLVLYTFFKVGSRNEQVGRTGLAHFFEHMMFNGSQKYGPGEFDRLMEAAGGSNNAFTSHDITGYQDWFPLTALPIVLELEADRIAALSIAPDKVESERKVVLNERRLRTDGDPDGALGELFYATAYKAHPYRWPILGWESDIRSWQLTDLVNFHRTYYAPNNALMVLVGDIEPGVAFARLEQAFGGIPAQPAPEPVRTVEPPQQGERRAELRVFAQLPALKIAYHVPASGDPSAPVMKLTETVLMAGQSSRLYRRLVDQDQSVLGVSGGYGEWNFDPTLFTVEVKVKEGHQPAAVERATYEELSRLAKAGPTDQELRKAKNIVLVNLFRQQKTLDGKAVQLGVYELFHGGWEQLTGMETRIEAVTAEQIRAFVAKYLVAENRTVVTLVPTQTPPDRKAVTPAGGQP